jgi:hypothetical protein
MLYVAPADDSERRRGGVVRVEASPFAPSPRLPEDCERGVVDGQGVTRRSSWELRQLLSAAPPAPRWRRAPLAPCAAA